MFQEKETEDSDSSEQPQEPELPIITAAPDAPDSSDGSSDAVPAPPPQPAPAVPQDDASSDEAIEIPDEQQQPADDSSEGDSSATAASSASDVIPDSSEAPEEVPADSSSEAPEEVPADSSSESPTVPVKKPVPAWCKHAWCGRTTPPAAPPQQGPNAPLPPIRTSQPPSTSEAKPVPSWCKFAWCGRTTPPAAPESANEGANASPKTPEVPSGTSKAPSTPETKPSVPSWCKFAWCGRTTPKSAATAESPEAASPSMDRNDQGCEGNECDGQNQAVAAAPPPPMVAPVEIEDMQLPCFGASCGRSGSPDEAVDETAPTKPTGLLPGSTDAQLPHTDSSHTASQDSEVKNSSLSLPHADVDGVTDRTLPMPHVDDAADDEWVVVDTTKLQESSSSRLVAAGITLQLCLILASYSYFFL